MQLLYEWLMRERKIIFEKKQDKLILVKLFLLC